jgi:hypothetical protein
VRRVAVSQSNYLPWKGYFDLIHDVDLFLFYDDVQFTKNDWRNRNRVKSPLGLQWLTIPVGADLRRRICDVTIRDSRWQVKHWRTLRHLYGKTPFFERYTSFLEDVYLGREWKNLSELNQFLIRSIASDFLGIKTVFGNASDFASEGRKQERLLGLLESAGAELYVSGPKARYYVDPGRFDEAGIELVWKDYSGYPEYPQLHPPFEHGVTVLDLLFHVGPDAPQYIWGWRTGGWRPAAAS